MDISDLRFDEDLFISYAHIDNQPLLDKPVGWIARFHKDLDSMLSMKMGKKAKIWRDIKLQGNDVFSDEIVDRFREAALFVSVLSPRYLNSEWCTREVREFCQAAQEKGGLEVDNQSRVFKVIKTPVETQDALPNEIQEVLGYPFYIFDDSDKPLELDPVFGTDIGQEYLRKLNALAWDIAELLKRFSTNGTPSAGAFAETATETAAVPKPVVYLAECSYDRHEEREKIKDELKDHGYTVLPRHQLPRLETDYVAEVKRQLEGCQLSIHLVGRAYGGVPDGPSQKSGVILQNEWAAVQSKAGGLERVIWLPEDTRSDQFQQRAFIEAINQDAEVQVGADVITGSLEELKTVVRDKLQKIEEEQRKKAEAPADAEAERKNIYLICDERDRKNTVLVRKFLRAQGFQVKIPLFSGDAETVHEAEKEQLTHCDAILLYYGEGDEAWKFSRENDLKKMVAYRGGRPLPVRYIYLADPVTDDKEELIEFEEPNLINALDGFSEVAMNAFVEAVHATKTSR